MLEKRAIKIFFAIIFYQGLKKKIIKREESRNAPKISQ